MIVTLTAERLRELLVYDSLTGVFTWRVARGGVEIGQIGGTLTSYGYWQITVDRKLYRAHRLAWFYVYGVFPPQHLDHINGDRADNQIVNLRPCDDFLNGQNRSLHGSGTTGYLGVTFDKSRQKFKAQIKFQGVSRNLGRFPTAIEAHSAYLEAKKTIHEFQGY